MNLHLTPHILIMMKFFYDDPLFVCNQILWNSYIYGNNCMIASLLTSYLNRMMTEVVIHATIQSREWKLEGFSRKNKKLNQAKIYNWLLKFNSSWTISNRSVYVHQFRSLTSWEILVVSRGLSKWSLLLEVPTFQANSLSANLLKTFS